MEIVVLKGGLGNQLFQLSLFLKLLGSPSGNKIYLDNKSGFLLDYKHKRNCELQISQKYLLAKWNLKVIVVSLLFINKFLPFLLNLFPFKVITDKDNYFLKSNKKDTYSEIYKKNFIYNGCFQNYFLVNEVIPKLSEIIYPYLNQKCNKKFNALYKKIKSTNNSVALGIRFYEESPDPESLFRNGKPKTSEDYNKIILKLERELKSPIFFIFVQEENEFTDHLVFNSPNFFITHSKGYEGAWSRLKAQSLCNHHIFNNSTFYWWGCMISKMQRKNNKKMNVSSVHISDNFLFSEMYNPEWKKF